MLKIKHKKQKKKTSSLIRRMISILVMISLVLLTIPSSALKVSADSEASGYQFSVVNGEDGTTADIIGDGSKLNQDMQLKEIISPDGESMDLDHVSYHVTQNGEYTFKVNYVSPSGEQSEDIPVTVDTLKSQRQMTVKDLKMSRNRAAVPLSVPMYIEGDDAQQGTYSFAGGSITGIADQTFGGLSYKFTRAEIRILEGATVNIYPINYYDEVDGVFYYTLAREDGSPPQDFDIAYEVPAGAQVVFMYGLNTASYPVTLVNDKESEGFHVKLVSGIDEAPDGSLSARYHARVKVELTYPTGYYISAGPNGEKAVGIEFSEPGLDKDSNNDKNTRTMTYSFTYPEKAVTMTVVGDEQTTGLTYGLYDGTGNLRNPPKEQGRNWWKATDANGNYTEGQPFYGTAYNDDTSDDGTMKVRGGTSTGMDWKLDSQNPDKKTEIATGTFHSGQTLDFEYANWRINLNDRPPYFYWPSPILSFCYFPNGVDYSTGTPIVETFPLWDPGWNYTGPPDTPITRTYTAGNGAKITLTVKEARYKDYTAAGGIPVVHVPIYRVHIKIENMKNSFYLKTQGLSSVQGTHYFRNLENISTDSADDSYLLYSAKDGGGAGGLTTVPIKEGSNFIDKLAIYNQNMPGNHGVPWAGAQDAFFKFGITPQWGYTMPRIESYSDKGLIMTNKPIEVEKKEGSHGEELPLGSYSWFHSGQGRKDVSPFQYVMFMPVESLDSKHEMRAIDVKTDKITGTVTNNTEYTDGDPGNTIVNNETFDLLTNDKIIFNPDFKAPVKPNKTFIGFTAEITAPDNPLLPANYTLTLGKDIANKVYFKPGDTISISDYFHRDSAALLDSWNNGTTDSPKGTLTDTEKERLDLLMYSKNLNVKIIPQYRDGTSTEGTLITGHVNKYLQDVNETALTYSDIPSDTKDVKIIGGSNIMFSSFADTFQMGNDPYTYYYNKDHTTSVNKADTDGEELASVKYDRGLTVRYVDENKQPFKDITDSTIYKTYTGHNKAVIKFPTVQQSPLGKVLDYWTVEEQNDDGSWSVKPNLKIREGDAPYEFASGPGANNKSIRLTPVWKDISPDAYISIPKNIVLTEDHTNLSPAGEYAGTKATVTYHNVNGSDKQVYVDVRKSFQLSLTTDATKKLTVSSYDTSGNLLQTQGVNEDYARVGELSKTSDSKDIWFNTKSQDGNGTYKGTFAISADVAAAGPGTLFYISAAASGGGG